MENLLKNALKIIETLNQFAPNGIAALALIALIFVVLYMMGFRFH